MPALLSPARVERLLVLAARRRGRVERDGLVEVACGRCGAHLAEARPGAQAWCPWCAEWSTADDDGPPRLEAS